MTLAVVWHGEGWAPPFDIAQDLPHEDDYRISAFQLSTSSPAAMGEGRKEQVEVTFGSSSHKPEHRSLADQRSLFFTLGIGELRQQPR